jgi:hypothetical protein|tara:strand:+ start:784 stop:1128 length:345 start_codon:yes stop_codon:yes gene_type:complete
MYQEIKTFTDLTFFPHMGGVASLQQIGEHTLSIIAGGKLAMSSPKGLNSSRSWDFQSFEIGIIHTKSDEWVTKDILQVDSDTVGWFKRSDINNVIEMVSDINNFSIVTLKSDDN